MLKSYLIFASTVLFSSLASADPSKYSCLLVDEFDDWMINVDILAKEAEFFDNDHWSTLALTEQNFIETFPITLEYIFEGSDSMNPVSSYTLDFDIRGGRATAVLNEAKLDGSQENYEFTCKPN